MVLFVLVYIVFCYLFDLFVPLFNSMLFGNIISR